MHRNKSFFSFVIFFFSFSSLFSQFSSSQCTTSFEGDVIVHKLHDGYSQIGDVVFMNRTSQKVRAKYFAHKQFGQTVIDRYDSWRSGKRVILITSGAYGTGFSAIYDKPVGLTIDHGEVVNTSLEPDKDALVIVYNTGGIAITNIKDANLKIRVDGSPRTVNLNKATDKRYFIKWSEQVGATTFQTHLLLQDDKMKVYSNGSSSTAYRKVLVLAKDRRGTLFHVIYNIQHKTYSMFNVASKILKHQNSLGYKVIMAVNTDTGGANVMGSGGGAKDCNGSFLQGRSDRSMLTNALVYYHN